MHHLFVCLHSCGKATDWIVGLARSRHGAIECTYDEHQRRASREVDFVHYIDEADHVLNTKYRSKKSSKDYEMASDAVSDLKDIIAKIKGEASSEMTLSSKWGALQALISIGESVVDAPSTTLGSEVRKVFQSSVNISEAMCSINESVSEDGQLQLRVHRDLSTGLPAGTEGVRLVDHVKELEDSAVAYAMEMDLDEVLALLQD